MTKAQLNDLLAQFDSSHIQQVLLRLGEDGRLGTGDPDQMAKDETFWVVQSVPIRVRLAGLTLDEILDDLWPEQRAQLLELLRVPPAETQS